MANEAVMGIVATFQDEASAGLQRTARNVQTFSRDFRSAAGAIGRFGQAMTNVLVLTNLLPGSIGNAVNKTLLLGTATINAGFAVLQLIQIYEKLNKTHRVTIALMSILQALSGIGIAKVAVGVAAGGALAAGAIALANRAGESGVTANVPVRASGGRTPSVTVVNNGVMMGNEADARRLARQIQGFNREDERLGR